MYRPSLVGLRTAALFAALAFALSGQMTGLSIHGHGVAAAAYLPLALYGVDRATTRPLRGALVVAAAVALGFLTGRPQIHLLSLLLVGAYTLFRALQFTDRSSTVRPGGSLLGTLLGLGFLACLGVAAGGRARRRSRYRA